MNLLSGTPGWHFLFIARQDASMGLAIEAFLLRSFQKNHVIKKKLIRRPSAVGSYHCSINKI
jgi:hypothetical protein